MRFKQLNRRTFLFAVLAASISVFLARISDAEPPKTEAFRFVQLCDTQLGMSSSKQVVDKKKAFQRDVQSLRQAVKQINATKSDFVVICGDLVHDFDDKSVAEFKKIIGKLAVPCYCAPGNHDVGGKPTAASLRRYRQAIGKDYYSFEHKGYTFLIANTSLWKSPLEGESEKHDAWIKRTLKEAKKKGSPVFIAAHYPLFVKTIEEKDQYFNLPLDKRKELLALYENNGVVALLAGHTHKTIVKRHKGIQLVNGETTSVNFDKRPRGFRLWTVTTPLDIKHEPVPLKP
ncbi:MAG: metallophosphoesterase [Pirellulales bacterium]|nr:metallophosphoesterase [Pirellulales bacterium]